MIKQDYKGFQSNKPLFSRRKSRRKAMLIKGLLSLTAISAIGYGSVSFFGQDSAELAVENEALPLNLVNIDENTESHELALNLESDSNVLVANPQQSLANSAVAATQAEVAPIAAPEPSIKWQTIEVAKDDNLAKIFNKQDLSATDLHYMMKSDEQIKLLKKIRPGHEIRVATDLEGNFVALEYPYSPSETLVVNKEEHKAFSVEIDKKPITFKQRFATANINSSFYNAGIDAGLPDGIIMELAGVFEYDIDFALDIRKGDSFGVLYQEKFIDGKKAGYGDILSAQFVNQGDAYSAVQYTDLKERTAYYTPEGKALRKSFLRAPLKFNYVSSNYNPRRFHPIQKRVKPHRGVDYRAATGTPVRASGDGRVVKAAYDKYNGNYVFIQHGNNIVTKYLHFSKRAVKKGQRVKQGQIVGYVGSTGMSQAPHLHYEFVVNGVHRNPRTVKLPHAAPVAKAEMQRFKGETKQLLAEFETARLDHFARLNNEQSTVITE